MIVQPAAALAFTFAALALTLAAPAAFAETVPEPSDYRTDAYRAPVPAAITGGRTVDTDEAYELWEAGVPFIDVFPRAPKPANLPEGTIWREKPHTSIAGALWLPNVGYGRIADVTAAYFRRGLEGVTDGDKAKPVVLFCREECWMSWNAARRAIEWGYGAVIWYPEGVDGWNVWEYPTERLKPVAE